GLRDSRRRHAFPTRRSSDLAGTLDFAGPHRFDRHAEHEAGNDVGTTRDRGEVNVLLDAVIDEGKTLGRQRRAGGGDRAHGGEVVDRKSTRLNSSHVKISYAV